jgi:hypothetical protein
MMRPAMVSRNRGLGRRPTQARYTVLCFRRAVAHKATVSPPPRWAARPRPVPPRGQRTQLERQIHPTRRLSSLARYLQTEVIGVHVKLAAEQHREAPTTSRRARRNVRDECPDNISNLFEAGGHINRRHRVAASLYSASVRCNVNKDHCPSSKTSLARHRILPTA